MKLDKTFIAEKQVNCSNVYILINCEIFKTNSNNSSLLFKRYLILPLTLKSLIESICLLPLPNLNKYSSLISKLIIFSNISFKAAFE